MEGGTTAKRKLKRLKMPRSIPIIVIVAIFVGSVCADTDVQNRKNNTYEPSPKDPRGFFSPRMDYDQWRPVGRGDPLQNDPTYDYVPPVLERVHYWVEPPIKKKDDFPPPMKHEGKKSEILVLGVSSKKPSITPDRRNSQEPFMKFIDGPKFYHQHHPNMRNGNQPQRGPHPFHFQFHKNKFDDPHAKDDQRRPYTVLVPPPMPPSRMEIPFFKNSPPTTPRPVYTPTTVTTPPSAPPSTTPSPPKTTVSIQESNLIYQQSSTLMNNRWHSGPNQINQAGSEYVTWRTPTEAPLVFRQEPSTVKPSAATFTKSASENVVNFIRHDSKPPESQVVFPTETAGKIVFEQHSSFKLPSSVSSPPFSSFSGSSSIVSPFNSITDRPPLVLAPTPGTPIHMLHVTGSRPVTAHLSAGHPIHKGHVSDDTIGNAYVNIGKPNAHIQQEDTLTTFNQISPPINKRPFISSGMPFRKPTTEDAILETMQTMQPPPYTTEKSLTIITTKKTPGSLLSLLKNEVTAQPTTPPSTVPSTTYSFLPTSPPSTTPTPTTTSTTSLTTDPLFKHYKQPKEPLKGPMYLIIQGHSKVKTYGPNPKQPIRNVPTAETNEIHDADNKYPVKHLHTKKDSPKEEYSRSRVKNARNLKDLLVGDFGSSKDVKETEVGARYEVADENTEVTSEKYHKGIVESEELDRNMDVVKSRSKRQLEDFIPVVEDTFENFVYDYLKKKSEGSGVGAYIASAITHDSAEDDDNYDDDDNDNEDDDDDYK